ncbi:ANTAR domain-containing protein [Streptomyces sp. MS06]|uniref:ANTAR domain-containing protein n=1 Tax=Streptomyces sp. MS06 TaxID=3385974 RepID=UPI00399F887E
MALEQLLELSVEADTPEDHELGLGEDSLKVYQATGMVAAQLDVGVEEAFSRLRGRAFSEDLTISTVAARVLDGTVVFIPSGDEGTRPDSGHDEER